jgi:2-keto-4-pentenoate hydratase
LTPVTLLDILPEPSKKPRAGEGSLITNPAIQQIARAFLEARRTAKSLAQFPGAIPRDLATGYAIQEIAIDECQDQVVGWKVGLISADLQSKIQAAHLAGPIFLRGFQRDCGQQIKLAAISDGFAAIEVELVFAALSDAPAHKTDWTQQEASAFPGNWYFGVEFAASPLATINELGPAVIVADFGNNSGLCLGPRLAHSSIERLGLLSCSAAIDGEQVGTASATSIPGGPLASLRFLLDHVAGRGRPLRAGQFVSTGAITGVHRISPGQNAVVDFQRHGRMQFRVVPALPSTQG